MIVQLLFVYLSSHVQWLFGLVSRLSNAKVSFRSYSLLMQFRVHVVGAILYTLQSSHIDQRDC